MRKAIAIDFDGCLCENTWPEIGAPHWPVIRAAQLAQHEGAALILWTCRNGDLLDAAVKWCGEHGLIFDAVNKNLQERMEHYGSESRKISADEYWDDCAVHMPAPPNDPLTLEGLREMDGEAVWTPVYNLPQGGYYCLCNKGVITVPSGRLIDCKDIPDWTFYRRKPEAIPREGESA